jgi:hypothetical protein
MDDLHVLIKSLSETDKKFFRHYAALQTNETKYLQLFNAIEAMDVYDEQKIKTHFSGEAFVKQLSVAKNYLNEVILRTFRLTAEKESPEIALQLLMLDIRFLMSKKCFIQLKKTMKRAKKLAEEQENFLVLLNIFSLQRHLYTEFTFEAWENFSPNTIATEEKKILKKIENVNTIYDLYCRAKNIIAAEGEKNLTTASRKSLAEIYKHKLLQDSNTALSTRAKHWFFSTLHYKNLMQENYTDGLKHNIQHLQIFEKNPGFSKTRPLSHLTVLNNILECLHNLLHIKDAAKYLAQLKEVKTGNEREESGKQLYLAHHTLWYTLHTKRWDEAAQVAQNEFIRLNNDTKTRKDSKIIQYMMISVVLLTVRKYADAQKAVQQLLTFPKSGIREDILDHIKLLQVILFFKEENYTSASDFLRSLQRNAAKFPFLKLCCAYCKELLKAKDGTEKLRIQEHYRSQFKHLPQHTLPEMREMQYMMVNLQL